MKPDNRQIKVLQDYLHRTLKYRESYEEVYDHIISALESQPGDIDFEKAINTVIKNDFGGHDNLPKVEAGIKAAMIEEAKKTFIVCLKDLFKFPSINYPIVFGMMIYVIVSTQNIPRLLLSLISFAIIFTPLVVGLIRYYKVGYRFGDTGDSIRDESFRVLSYRPMWFFSMITLYLPMWHIIKFDVWGNTYPLVTTLFLLVPLVYNMAIFKVYKSEVDLKEAK